MKDLILTIVAMFVLLLSGVMYFNTVNTIEKHSVHPLYGNYQKFNADLERCSPWESCE